MCLHMCMGAGDSACHLLVSPVVSLMGGKHFGEQLKTSSACPGRSFEKKKRVRVPGLSGTLIKEDWKTKFRSHRDPGLMAHTSLGPS